MLKKIPLAWLQLTREKPRLLIALSGIAFADILMFMQLGFREALFNSNVRMHDSLDADIVLINPQSDALLSMEPFSQRRLYQALGLKGVKSVHPVYLDFTSWKNPQTRKLRNIQVIGINPKDQLFALAGVSEKLDKVKLPDVVLFDRGSRPEFGDVTTDFNKGKVVATEVAGRRVKVGGIFELGASFGADGNIITSDRNFLRLFADKRQRGLIDIGLIRLEPGTDPAVIKQQLISYLAKDIKILTKQEYADFEKAYWSSSTPIGFIFTLGTIIGFIVGTVIVYQILYSEVSDHLPEYATLKAMGYTQKYLLLVVFQEAIILAILGYIPGFGFAMFQYAMAKNATLLPIAMTLERAITVLILTIIMCCASGAIAVRKLQAADPADIF
ncbi:ABC transporter permease DevC [Chlorogloea sp. CCALA 695]|uniref:ABC transporter permease DevC n=1 Tax=Chlorogloea sp. CCALA 695 TaxID=2107693 RepID=UPI000D051385|nr:ABC transporter permease DevC [Chlorogloea sp. CCALA 695]PSB30300.1 ABC transporter [Chlorogloea sp. CCALA 695]